MGESSIFKVLSDPQRRDILVMLREGRMSAGEIAEKLGVSPPALSYHLRLLKGAELVTEYKEKNRSGKPQVRNPNQEATRQKNRIRKR